MRLVPEAGAGLLMEKELRYLGRRAGRARAAVRRDARRRQGVGQDRGDREPDPARRSAAHRRRHGLHVLQGDGQARRQVAGRGRQAGRGARHHGASGRARPAAAAAGRPRRRAEARGGGADRDASAWTMPPSAIAWGSTSVRAPCAPMPMRWRDAKTVVWNGPMGVFEIDAVRARARWRWRRPWPSVKGTTIVGGGDSIAAVKKAGVAVTRHAHLDRRRRVAGVPRRPDAAGRGRAARERSIRRPMRTPIIAGNWKMYKTVADAVKYVKEFRGLVKDVDRRRDRGRAAVHGAARRGRGRAQQQRDRGRAGSALGARGRLHRRRSARRWSARPAPST